MNTSPKYLLQCLLAASLALTGCGCRKVESSEDAPVQNSVPQGDEISAAPEAPALPKVDLWKPLARYLAGDYSAPCMHAATGPERKQASALIAPDGKYTFNEYKGDILKSTTFSINRSRDKDGSVRVLFSAMSDDMMIGAVSGDHGKGRVLNFVKGEGNIYGCDASSTAMALVDKPLHLVFATVLENASHKIGCVLPGDITRTPSELSIKDGVLSIGKYTYKLADMNEIVNISREFAEMSYTITNDKDETLALGLDQAGKVVTIMRQSKDESAMMCTSGD